MVALGALSALFLAYHVFDPLYRTAQKPAAASPEPVRDPVAQATEDPHAESDDIKAARARVLGAQDPSIPQGAAVFFVVPRSPAAKAGVIPGDIVIKVDEWSISGKKDYTSAMRGRRGSPKRLMVRRAAGTLELALMPAARLRGGPPGTGMEVVSTRDLGSLAALERVVAEAAAKPVCAWDEVRYGRYCAPGCPPRECRTESGGAGRFIPTEKGLELFCWCRTR